MNQNDSIRETGLAGLFAQDEFHSRHLGVQGNDARAMLQTIGWQSIAELIEKTVPASILRHQLLKLPAPCTEHAALSELQAIANQNQIWRSYIGAGYSNTFLPEPIRRNVLENPGWYTAYTPYQAEIAQGRLESLLNYQQMIIDLTGLPVSNASLLDEATAAAEAMTLIRRSVKSAASIYFVDRNTHQQVIEVIRTRAKGAGIQVQIGDPTTILNMDQIFGVHLQNPDATGAVKDWSEFIATVHAAGGMVSMGADLLSLMLIKSPGAMGADVAIGSAQRFGVPLGYGGPHAAFMAVRQEIVRSMPGRIIGVSKDAAGNVGLRMALQTREQHIRRDKATSNICTAQALLANIAAFYAVWHGPEGLTRIAARTHFLTRLLKHSVAGELKPSAGAFFDTLCFSVENNAGAIAARAAKLQINLGHLDQQRVVVSLDETVGFADVADLVYVLTGNTVTLAQITQTAQSMALDSDVLNNLQRTDPVLTHPVFNLYHSETEFMRYLKRLENKDFSLVHGMIPLGSCTMKLNAASEMAPVTWPGFANIHPFAPASQTKGYALMLAQLNDWLCEITGFAKVSFQPNSGAQGEYAGLLAIQNYQKSQGQGHRNICLIPSSAHGTNPASAQMLGLQIVVVACDAQGNVDLTDLQAKIDLHAANVAALMVTYPSTHGVFEDAIKQICSMIHAVGGQVYMDGANLNAQAGLCQPGEFGADVCHMNLHKTFCIPHGGGGPGMGPIAVAPHLAPYLPDHHAQAWVSQLESSVKRDQPSDGNAVSAAPYGSALILTISWMYIRMMGASGIRRATEVAILNANYVASRLRPYYPILYTGEHGQVAHECILDVRHLKAECGVTAEDIAKRLMDYGFHAPTLSFPVVDTLMVEPTESESKSELDRFCNAMIAIHGELHQIKSGHFDRIDNPLKNAPHTAQEVIGDWTHAYTREQAAYPLAAIRANKFWPAVKRVDGPSGDRNLICTCPPMSAYES
jgi:glycine dehydrogenase